MCADPTGASVAVGEGPGASAVTPAGAHAGEVFGAGGGFAVGLVVVGPGCAVDVGGEDGEETEEFECDEVEHGVFPFDLSPGLGEVGHGLGSSSRAAMICSKNELPRGVLSFVSGP